MKQLSCLDEAPRSYISYMEEISADDLYDGLVGYGLMGDKLPPVFSSESFLELCKRKNHNFNVNKKEGHGFITFRYAQNHHSYRLFGIPNPMAYELLCAKIRDNWDNIKEYFEKMTRMQPYKVSRTHIRKRPGKRVLFEMNYKNWKVDVDPVPSILLGARYCVVTDISKCFPSIYTHAVEWALVGKESVKERRRKNKKNGGWEEEIDKKLRCTTNNETHGILIGPHASNLISEIVLCRVDAELSEKWKYIRHIDDIECYVSTREDADNFIRAFDRALSKYGLSRNTSKTKILDLPRALQSSWVSKLRRYPLPEDKPLRYSDVLAFMDYAIDLEYQMGDLAVFNYAMKIISGHNMSINAADYLIKICCHLASIHPYLMPHLESIMDNLNRIDKNLLKRLSDTVYPRSLNEGDFYSTYYVLYFAVKYSFELEAFDINEVVDTDDCLLKFFAMIYCKKKNKTAWISMLEKNAEDLEKTGEFDNNWLFCYEILKQHQLSGDWKYLKKQKVIFYDDAAFAGSERLNGSIE